MPSDQPFGTGRYPTLMLRQFERGMFLSPRLVSRRIMYYCVLFQCRRAAGSPVHDKEACYSTAVSGSYVRSRVRRPESGAPVSLG